MNPGDLSWDDLSALGDLQAYERTMVDEISHKALDAEVLITNKCSLSRQTLQELPDLRYIGVTATGYNIVDLPFCQDKGIIVTNVPSYSTRSVAQAVFAHVLRFTHRVEKHADSVREGKWERHSDFSYCLGSIDELEGKKLGIFGYGEIGREVAKLGRAFGMSILIHSRSFRHDHPEHGKAVSVDELFGKSDILTLHCPLTEDTAQLVNAERLGKMKKTSLLINTARGPLIDEQALAFALESGTIAGAGIDVLSSEPPAPDNPLLKARHCYVTPHYAWATLAARSRLMKQTVANLEAFMRGKPINVVTV